MKQVLATKTKIIQNRILVSITYKRYLPNISNIIIKKWNILQISPTLQIVFVKKPIIIDKEVKILKSLYEITLYKAGNSSRLTFLEVNQNNAAQRINYLKAVHK